MPKNLNTHPRRMKLKGMAAVGSFKIKAYIYCRLWFHFPEDWPHYLLPWEPKTEGVPVNHTDVVIYVFIYLFICGLFNIAASGKIFTMKQKNAGIQIFFYVLGIY